MSNINNAAVLNPFTDLTANILDYVPRATTSEFGIVAIGSGINVDRLGRIYLDTQEYSDRLSAIEAQAASTLDTQQSEVAAAIAQVNLSQSQTITALTLEVGNLKTDLTNRADQLAQDVTDITQQLTEDKAAFTQEIQDALVYLENAESVASALRTPRKIQTVPFDGTQDINLPVFTSGIDGLVPKRVGTTTTKYLREDGGWVVPPNTTYPLLTQANAEAGTSTTANTISAKVLKDAILYHTPVVTDITGNAGTATKLQTPRTVGGVSFDGTANINLPGVNIAGNQDTSGNAATSTKLATARTINGVSFDGSANITLPLASTSVSGTVQLNNTLTSTATTQALTAAQGKVLNDSKLAKTENAVSASKLQTSRTISLTGGVTGSVSFDGSANATIATTVTGLGAANGIATLDSNGQVPSNQLPSYVDDVLEYLNVAAFPTTGETDKIYVETTGNTTYRWGGTAYVKITSGEVSSVAGKTGVVTLSKADVGLAQVDNTPDTQKPISTATQLALNNKVNKSDVIDINKGGTGAATAAAARTNLGLGTAALKNTGSQLGNVMEVGAYGLGGVGALNLSTDFQVLKTTRTGFYQTQAGSDFYDGQAIYLNKGYWLNALAFPVAGGAPLYAWSSADRTNFTVKAFAILGMNTTTDGNGFVKSASPIVQLHADKIELNDEAQQQDIVFEKLGVGEYLIKGSSGFAQEGWYIEQPKDANGNVYHAVVYEQLENGDISVKTFEQKLEGTRIVADLEKPVDIKENRFISIRLNELPQDTTAPQNPTIVDNEGNPAPSHLHELVNGTWTISSENAAILENERLAAMPSLTRRQFRLALVLNGYNLADIETLINSIEDQMQRTIAQIEWQDATDFQRTSPTLLMMAELLQLTSEQVDQLWSYGLTL